MIVDHARNAALREQAIAAKASRTPVPLQADELLELLDSHAAALELSDAVAAFQTIDGADGASTGAASAAEIRNRFRRRVEERTLRVNTALAKFRAATEGTR
jgi:hypothetical protein